MKKILLPLIFNFTFLILNSSSAQIVCIYCYEQNDSISQNVNNLILNGSFENTNCQPNIFSNSFCPNANYYGCDIVNWTCTGGGVDTYASIDDNTFTQTADGALAAYFGNGSAASACSPTFNDTSCLTATGCELLNIPAGYPTNDLTYGGSTGVSLEQTVSGLTIGSTYVLEFWAGGEPQSHGWMDAGVFAVDVGFGKTYLRNKPTCPGCVGTTFIIEFNATSTSHTIRFTNWGHICIPCTELILDNVRLYTLAELSPSVPSCSTVPVALFNAPHHICPGTCTDFTNMSVNASTYQWTFQGANPSTSTDVNPTNICYSTPGSYDVSLIATGAGGSDTLTLPNYMNVYPYPPPQGIHLSVDTLIANQGAVSYQWYFNGVLIPGATDYFFVITMNGDYNVVCTDANGCEVEAAYFDAIGINEPTGSGGISFAPNPVDDVLSITNWQSVKASSNTISVYNTVGQKIFSVANDMKGSIDCRHFPPGVYFLELRTGEKTFRNKFIKQ
jgi:PKD repeat protein